MKKTILFIEPFYGGSHKQLIDTLTKELPEKYSLVTLNAKKWHWRARCSALKISQLIPIAHEYEILFCSSVLNLTELIGLRPDLVKLRKIMYFHENQLEYPKREIKARDFQFGYNQITSCLVADTVLFNSNYNMYSFLNNVEKFLKIMPDNRPVNLRQKIQMDTTNWKPGNSLHIIWPHRWEFDKGPEEFFEIAFKLKEDGVKFTLSVLGEMFTDVPEIFHKAKDLLKEHISNWGFAPSKEKYYEILQSGHVVLSTAKHEFFGVAVLEAVHCGCFPLVPNRLVYPEIYNKVCLYEDVSDAVSIIKNLSLDSSRIHCFRNFWTKNFSKFSSNATLPEYLKLFE